MAWDPEGKSPAEIRTHVTDLEGQYLLDLDDVEDKVKQLTKENEGLKNELRMQDVVFEQNFEGDPSEFEGISKEELAITPFSVPKGIQLLALYATKDNIETDNRVVYCKFFHRSGKLEPYRRCTAGTFFTTDPMEMWPEDQQWKRKVPDFDQKVNNRTDGFRRGYQGRGPSQSLGRQMGQF